MAGLIAAWPRLARHKAEGRRRTLLARLTACVSGRSDGRI